MDFRDSKGPIISPIGPVKQHFGDIINYNFNIPKPEELSRLPSIPEPPSDFTGRNEELQELLAKFASGTNIIGLRGIGGVGKTALALKLAESLKDSYPDGQIMVDMRGTDDNPATPSEAMGSVIHAYHADEKLPDQEAEIKKMYLSMLAGKRALLLLDNALDDKQVLKLIPPKSCGLLVTSRKTIMIPGLFRKDLDVLKPKEALELLLKVCCSTSDSVEPRGTDQAWSDIARLCGFLPLALRAAGSYLANAEDVSPARYSEKLKDERTRLERIGEKNIFSDRSLAIPMEELGIVISPPKGRLINVPPLPDNFIPRPLHLEELRKALLSPEDRRMAITGTFRKVGLQGMGGIGKTVLASALARDYQVMEAFSDGIIWITLGRQTDLDLTSRQWQLAKSLDENQATISDVQDGLRRLRKLLEDKSCLLVLDDVWTMEHLRAFYVLGSNCKMLITTRNQNIVRSLGAREYRLDVLNEKDSLELLSLWSEDQKILPPEAKEVAKECDNLPLALAMVGAMAKGKSDLWKSILHSLKSADLEKIAVEFPDYPYPNLMRAIEVSVDTLEPKQHRCYIELAIFPEDIAVPFSAVQVLWDIDEHETHYMIGLLNDRSLVRLKESALILHDLQYDFVVKRSGDLKLLHNQFLSAYEKWCPHGWPSGPNDGYFFQHLTYHQIGAGRKEDLRLLLLDFNWMKAKLDATDVNALISDYDYLNKEEDFRLIQSSILLSANVLLADKGQLQCQLYGRLVSRKSIPLVNLLQKIRCAKSKSWLCSLTQGFTPPGGPLVRILPGHRLSVNAIAIASESNKAISASDDRTLKVWDLETGTDITLEGHADKVTAVSITPDGKQAVSASDDGTLRIWDIEKIKEIKTFRGHGIYVTTIIITPDGKRAVSASNDRTIKVWDLSNGKEIRTIAGHNSVIMAAAITPDGKIAISASDDETLTVWNLKTGTKVKTLRVYNKYITAIAITPNGKRAVSASHGGIINVWDLVAGEEIGTLEGHTKNITAIAIAPNGDRAISVSTDRIFKVWDLKTGEETGTLKGHAGNITAIAITPDGKRAVSASEDRTLKIWDLEARWELGKLEGHASYVKSIAITLDGKRAISASSDETIKVWDIETGGEVDTLHGIASNITTVAIAPDGKRAVSTSIDEILNLKVWDLDSGTISSMLDRLTSYVTALAITPDGKRAIYASSDRSIKVWDIDAGIIFDTFEENTSKVTAIAITPDGKKAILASDYEMLTVWDLQIRWEADTIFSMLDGITSYITAVAITPDGKKAISLSSEGILEVRDLETLSVISTFEGHIINITAVTITLDGKRAISASFDGTLMVWDLETWKVIHTLKGHTSNVTAIAITPDGNRAISASSDGTLIAWDLKVWIKLGSFEEYTKFIRAVAIAPDGKTAILASFDGVLTVWDLDVGMAIATFEGHNKNITAIAMTPDGKKAISVSSEGTLEVWDLETLKVLRTFEGHTSNITAVAIALDGRKVVLVSNDKNLKIGYLGADIELSILQEHSERINAVALTQKGGKAVLASSDRTLKIYDLKMKKIIATIYLDEQPTACAIAADGAIVVAGESMGRMHFLKIESETHMSTLLMQER